MSNTIKLNLINRCMDSNNSDYVIFQKNELLDSDVQDVAWIVIKNLGNGSHHPFDYSMGLKISAKDSDGNYMPEVNAENGIVYSVKLNDSGHILSQDPDKKTASSDELEIWNSLSTGAIDGEIYRDGKVLAKKQNIVPGSKANFKFKPSIYIGCVSQVQQGEVINSNVTVQYLTEIPLLGISQGDIVVTGGGTGSGAMPYAFTLENYS